MYKDEERLLFSNFITVISILLAVYLFVAGNFSFLESSLNSQQSQITTTFHIALVVLYNAGFIVGALITLSVLRIIFSSKRLLKCSWFKKNQMTFYIILDILLICLFIPIFIWLGYYA